MILFRAPSKVDLYAFRLNMWIRSSDSISPSPAAIDDHVHLPSPQTADSGSAQLQGFIHSDGVNMHHIAEVVIPGRWFCERAN